MGLHGFYFKRSIALFLIITICTLTSTIFFVRYLLSTDNGILDNYPEVIFHQGELVFSPKALNSLLVKGGLTPGTDVVLSIAGEKVSNTRDVVRIAYLPVTEKPYSITVRKLSGEIMEYNIIPQIKIFRVEWIIAFLFNLSVSFTAYFLLYRYPGNWGFNTLSIASAVYLLVSCFKPFFYENFFSQVCIHIGLSAPWLLVLFGLFYPRPKGAKVFRAIVLTMISLYFVSFVLCRLYFIGRWFITGNEELFNLYRLLGRVNNVMNGVAYVFFILLIIFSYKKSVSFREKELFSWMITGFLLALTLYFFAEELFFIRGETPGNRYHVGNISTAFLIIMPVFLVKGITASKKFDFKNFRIGILLQSILVVLTVFVFSVFYLPVKEYLKGNNGLPEDIAGFIPLILFALLLLPLYGFLKNKIEKIFYYRGTPLEQIKELERKNKILEAELEKGASGLKEWGPKVATEKIKAIQEFLRGYKKREEKSFYKLRQSIEVLDREYIMLKEIIEDLQEESTGRGVEYEKFVSIEVALEKLKEVYIFKKSLLDRIGDVLLLNRSLPAEIEPVFLVNKAIYETENIYPQIKVRVDAACNDKIICNPDDIYIALVQLFCNAWETQPDSTKGIWVTIFLEGKERIIEIADKGMGFSSDPKKSQIPFFTTRESHWGLGLWIVRLAVEKSGGTLCFLEDSGNRIQIKLPGVINNLRSN